MSNYTKYSRRFLKKVIRKIAYRGKMPIKKARTFLDHKPNLNNIKFILRCFKIMKFDEDFFNLRDKDLHLIKIDGDVYVVEMSPVFFYVEKYSPVLAEFMSDWMKALTKDVINPTPPEPKVPITLTDKRSKVVISATVLAHRFKEIFDAERRKEVGN